MTVVRASVQEDLLGVLRRELGPEVDFADGPTPLTGGFWAELVAFRLTGAPGGWDGPLVARVMPDAATAAKETAIQRAVAAQGYPTPTVHAAGGPDQGIDGKAFLVMDLAPGQPMLAGLDGARVLRQLPSLARRLPVTLARAMADLHRLDTGPVVKALDGGDVPRPSIPSMLALLRASAEAIGRSDLVRTVDWLTSHPPPEEPIVLCHGDLHPFNVLVGADGSIAVLDWSAAILAPAAFDIGFTSLMIGEPPLLAPPPMRAVVRGAGRVLARRFLRAYEEVGATIDPSSLAWHQGLHAARALLDVATWSRSGAIDGERRGHPWVIGADALAGRLRHVTGISVEPR